MVFSTTEIIYQKLKIFISCFVPLFCNMSQSENRYKSCQSCGIPFDKAAGKGTEADGNESEKYCSYCYVEGAFVQPNWTVADMQAYIVKKLQQYGLPAIIAELLTRGIPKLERWKKQEEL